MYAEKFFLSCQKQFRYPLQISFILSAEWSGTGAYGCSVLTDHSHSQEIDNEPDKYGIFCPLPGIACVTRGCININQNISTTKINVKMGSLTPAHSKALVQKCPFWIFANYHSELQRILIPFMHWFMSLK